jgi:hypothetical protein
MCLNFDDQTKHKWNMIFKMYLLLIQFMKAKLLLCLIKHQDMKAFRGTVALLHEFWISVLYGDERSVSRPGCFTPWEEPSNSTVSLKAKPDAWEKK